MSFVDEHEQWCRDRGLDFLDMGLLGPPPNVDLSIYPEDLAVWHRSRFIERLVSPPGDGNVLVALGIADGEGDGLGPHLGPGEGLSYSTEEIADLLNRPEPERTLMSLMHPFLAAEANWYSVAGRGHPRSGWLYAFSGDFNLYRPIATSIAQYLYLVRQFTDHGIFDHNWDPGYDNCWSDPSLPWPPEDTPMALFDCRYEYPTVGEFRIASGTLFRAGSELGPHMPGSYLAIAPDFIPVNHLDPLP